MKFGNANVEPKDLTEEEITAKEKAVKKILAKEQAMKNEKKPEQSSNQEEMIKEKTTTEKQKPSDQELEPLKNGIASFCLPFNSDQYKNVETSER